MYIIIFAGLGEVNKSYEVGITARVSSTVKGSGNQDEEIKGNRVRGTRVLGT